MTGILQIVITAWIGVVPTSYTLPKVYYPFDAQACEQRLDELAAMRKPGQTTRISLECVPSDRRAI